MNIENTEFGGADCDAFATVTEGGKIYHLSGIQKVIRKTFGHETIYLSARQNSEIFGVLPLVHLKSRLFGNFLVSTPFFNYGGVCANEEETRQLLLDAAISEARKRDCSHIELRHTSLRYSHLQSKKSKVAMLLELPETSEMLWKAFKSKLRSQIRKPEKEGVTTKIGRLDLVDDFYHVFSINMRDLGTPVYTKKLFINILNTFSDSSWIVMAYKDQQPLAAGFLLGFRDILEIPWASSLRAYNRLAGNMLMYWHALQLAIDKGYKQFDFGRSTPGEGTFKFKQQWGAKPLDLYWEYWLPNGEQLPDISPKNSKYQAAIQLWQKLPVPLTRILGPAIVKNIP